MSEKSFKNPEYLMLSDPNCEGCQQITKMLENHHKLDKIQKRDFMTDDEIVALAMKHQLIEAPLFFIKEKGVPVSKESFEKVCDLSEDDNGLFFDCKDNTQEDL